MESIAQRFSMHESRLGDEIDDFCIKCKRLTNHSIVSLLNGNAAKVRCRTCYHDHDFRNGEPMPSKKELAKAKLVEQELAGAGSPATATATPVNGAAEPEAPVPVVDVDEAAAPVKKGRKTAKAKG